MSKFNTRTTVPATFSPVSSTGETHTALGGQGFLRDKRSELFLLAVANMVGEKTFHEDATSRDSRFTDLVRALAVEDFVWLSGMIGWLRDGANMRSAAVVAAAEAVQARVLANLYDGNAMLITSALRRADEPGEFIAYWRSRFSGVLPKPVKKGLAAAAVALYTERSYLKWNSASQDYQFADVINLVRPRPQAPWQETLFKYILDNRHHRDGKPDELIPTISKHTVLMDLPVKNRRTLFDQPGAADLLRAAGMTWEALAGWLQGPLDAKAWETIIPSMGSMALVRNLRNFDQAGVSDKVAMQVAAKISDPEQVAASRQFPMRYLAAYQHAPSLRWAYPLETALGHSLSNIPALPGRTLVLVDRSGSMWDSLSEQSTLSRADAAAIFGTALAMRADDASLVQFGTDSAPVTFRRGESVLKVLERFGGLGGTNTAKAVRLHYREHDRVVIVTDEQASYSWHGNPADLIPANVPLYTWNLAGYRAGHAPSGSSNRHTFGGLTDVAFKQISLLESAKNARWPWDDVPF